jgi:hypothetical protein
VSSDRLHLGASGVGLLDAGFGAGGILAATRAARFADSRRPRRVLGWVVVLSALPLGLFSVLSQPAVGVAAMLVGGAANAVIDVVAATTLQRVVPAELLGRCDALLSALARTGLALGALLAPLVLSLVGLQPALLLAAAAPTALALVGLTRTERLDESAGAAADALAPTVAVLSSLELFAGLPRTSLEALVSQGISRKAHPGEVLLKQGDPAEVLLVLLEGSCDVRGARKHITSVSAPDVLGEIGLLKRSPRTANVVATTECSLLEVPGPLFLATVLPEAAADRFQALADVRLARYRGRR